MAKKFEYRIVEEFPGEFRPQWRVKTSRFFDWIGFTRDWSTVKIVASLEEAKAVIDDQRARRAYAAERNEQLKEYPKVTKYPT